VQILNQLAAGEFRLLIMYNGREFHMDDNVK